jgi:hypothetical protein
MATCYDIVLCVRQIELEGETDLLTQDRLQIFYPSNLERLCFTGPWHAAQMVTGSSVDASIPFVHPYYTHAAVHDPSGTPGPPWKFAPFVRSRYGLHITHLFAG